MSNFSAFFSSGSSGIERSYELYFPKSTMFTFPDDPNLKAAIVSVFGSGGGGALYVPANVAGYFVFVTGGGGGAFCQKKVLTPGGKTATITIPAEVGSVTYSTSIVTNGSDGGQTSFSMLNVDMLATGGKGGKYLRQAANTLSSFTPRTIEGGVGGTASGGDINFDGGDGGYITVASSTVMSASNYVQIATGGGSSGSIYGDGQRGGNVNVLYANTTTANGIIMTGGGGVASSGADFSAVLSAPTFNGHFLGGGLVAPPTTTDYVHILGLEGAGSVSRSFSSFGSTLYHKAANFEKRAESGFPNYMQSNLSQIGEFSATTGTTDSSVTLRRISTSLRAKDLFDLSAESFLGIKPGVSERILLSSKNCFSPMFSGVPGNSWYELYAAAMPGQGNGGACFPSPAASVYFTQHMSAPGFVHIKLIY